MKRLFVIAPLLVLVGCAQNISPNSYSVGSVGMVNRTIAGTVISARGVDISGTSALGGTAGALRLVGEFVLISLVPLVVQSLVVLPGQQSNLQQQNKQAWNMLSKLRMGI